MKHRVVALFVLSALGSLLLAGGGRSAGHGSGVIAFTRADGIYAMDVEGSHVHALMQVSGTAVANIRWLAWSPNGKQLAYWYRGQIWVMNADGSHDVALVGRASTLPLDRALGGPTSPTWSPDGKWIAFTTGAGRPAVTEDRALWVMKADGTDMHRVAGIPAPYPAVELAWSPSGTQFAYTRWLWGEGASAIYLMHADGSHQPGWKAFTSVGANPDWSRDGRRLAFTYRNQIAVVGASGHGLVRLTSGRAFSFDPSWSPDGRKIAFVREPAAKAGTSTLMKGSEIYVMNADGTGVRQLTHDTVGEASPAWQPSS